MTELQAARIRLIARQLLIDALKHLGQFTPLLPVDFRALAAQLDQDQRRESGHDYAPKEKAPAPVKKQRPGQFVY